MVGKSPVYSTSEIAKLVGVSKNTLIRWEQDGVIPSALRDGRGWRVWCKDSLDKIIELKKSKQLLSTKSAKEPKLLINVIGYGNQAVVWAKNLRDSGVNVNILLRGNSPSVKEAKKDGFEVLSIEKGLSDGEIFCLLIPDENHESFFNNYSSYIKEDSLFILAHGYSIGYLGLKIPARVALLAPKAVAKALRFNYLEGSKTMSSFYASSVRDEKIVRNLAAMLGFYPLIKSSPLHEAVSDLFTEQALLCGGVPAIILRSFEILKEQDVPEELIVQECIQELSYLLDLMKKEGLLGMFKAISPLAFSGAMKLWDSFDSSRDIDDVLKKTMDDINSKRFVSYHKNFDREEKLAELKFRFRDIDRAIFNLNNPSEGIKINKNGGDLDVS